MDLIYTDKHRTDQGVLLSYELDHQASTDTKKNTFQIKTPLQNNPLELGDFWRIDGTEYGGIIDKIKADTAKKVVFAGGRTWRGILGSKIIEPDKNANYYTVTGDANMALATVVNRIGLRDLFTVKTTPVKSINYTFERYVDAYSGIIKMLAKNGLKLMLEWKGDGVELEAKEITNWDNEIEISNDMFDFVIEKNAGSVNHLIGLGQGELAARQVVHKYVDAEGNISNTQTFTGLEEVAEVYDYPNVESLQELNEATEAKLQEKATQDGLKVTSHNIEADIGDSFTAYETYTKTTVTQYVINKITTLSGTNKKTNYEVGII